MVIEDIKKEIYAQKGLISNSNEMCCSVVTLFIH